MSEEERIRRAFKILFYNLDKTRKEIERIKKRLAIIDEYTRECLSQRFWISGHMNMG